MQGKKQEKADSKEQGRKQGGKTARKQRKKEVRKETNWKEASKDNAKKASEEEIMPGSKKHAPCSEQKHHKTHGWTYICHANKIDTLKPKLGDTYITDFATVQRSNLNFDCPPRPSFNHHANRNPQSLVAAFKPHLQPPELNCRPQG